MEKDGVGSKRRGGLNCKLGLKDRSNIGKRKRLRISHQGFSFQMGRSKVKQKGKRKEGLLGVVGEVKEGYPKET